MAAQTQDSILKDPRWLTLLFSSTEWSWVWLAVRIYLGVQWLSAGWHKLFEEAWMGDGSAVKAFWERIVVVPANGRPAIAYDWYREFIEFMLNAGWHAWFAKLIAIGEVGVGIAMFLGAFTGIAAFGGALMNWNFMLAGTASTNPVLGIMGIALLAAWKVAGWWGADRYLLPLVGAPWQRGPLLGGAQMVKAGEPVLVRRGLVQWAIIAAGGAMIGLSLAYLSGLAQVALGLAGVTVLASSAAIGDRTTIARDARPAAQTVR